MTPEKQILLDDILDGGRRAATLRAGGKILRRRRVKRLAIRSLAVLAVVILAALEIPRHAPSRIAQKAAPVKFQPQYMTDDELLALFPNVPVGLITTADGKKRLIFLHPGDEERYVTRL